MDLEEAVRYQHFREDLGGAASGGGGSGGRNWLNGSRISLSGVLSAMGGSGADRLSGSLSPITNAHGGGGGGGGRIKVSASYLDHGLQSRIEPLARDVRQRAPQRRRAD